MEPWNLKDVVYDDLALSNSWTFYEVYEPSSFKKGGNKNKEADYLNNIKPVCKFSNLVDFMYFWQNTQYSKLTPIFTDPFSNTIKKLKNAELKIGSIALFKDDIEPKWEDPSNQHGGEYSIKFNGSESSEIVSMWETIIFTLIGNCSELASEVYK